ncbi:hypothetical protein BDR04DRAFT_618486 [Suillus decipiens]|nr:hypothetical protein BDR04DRAFT_618486 [Suillus decipiens]
MHGSDNAALPAAGSWTCNAASCSVRKAHEISLCKATTGSTFSFSSFTLINGFLYIEIWPTRITTAGSSNSTTHPKVHRQDRGVTILNNPNNRTEASLTVNLTVDLGTNLNRHHKQFTYNNPLNPVVLVEALAAWLVLLAHVFAAVLRTWSPVIPIPVPWTYDTVLRDSIEFK